MSEMRFEAPAPPEQEPAVAGVSMAARLAGCAIASSIAIIPALAAALCAFRVSRFVGAIGQEPIDEPMTVSSLAANFTELNMPVVIAICLAALLAIGYGIFLAFAPQQRLAGVGMPFALGAPILGGMAALALWRCEAIILSLFAGDYVYLASPTLPPGLFVLLTYLLALLALAASFLGSIVSLLRSPHSRGVPLSATRATIWITGGVLLFACAVPFYFRVTG